MKLYYLKNSTRTTGRSYSLMHYSKLKYHMYQLIKDINEDLLMRDNYNGTVKDIMERAIGDTFYGFSAYPNSFICLKIKLGYYSLYCILGSRRRNLFGELRSKTCTFRLYPHGNYIPSIEKKIKFKLGTFRT